MLLLFAVLVAPAYSAPLAGADPVLGTWAWGGGKSHFTLTADGKIAESKRKGNWVLKDPSVPNRTYEMRWAGQPHVDTMTLNTESNRLEGSNQFGKKLAATRVVEPAPEVGGPKVGGIVLSPPNTLKQAQGGFGHVIDELEVLLSPYGVPQDDQAAHPDAIIYSGPPTDPDLGTSCEITYLMPLAKAEKLLMKSAGLRMKHEAVAPGFPPGLSIYSYDIKYDIYDHLSIVVDGADQVVTIQFKSDHVARDIKGDRMSKAIDFDTTNYINLKKTGKGFATRVKGVKKTKGPVLINTAVVDFKETVTWYVPKPLVRQILFNVAEKKKARGDG